MRFTTSRTSRSTWTFVACLRLIGGGTFGATVSTAFSSPMISGSVPFASGPGSGAVLTVGGSAVNAEGTSDRLAMVTARRRVMVMCGWWFECRQPRGCVAAAL